MCQVDMISRTIEAAGIATRAERRGPEADLLARFLARRVSQLQSSKARSSYAIFVEPMLDSGYPDAVLVSYDRQTFNSWIASREALSSNDLKIMSYLRKRRSAACPDISSALGFGEREIERSLAMLRDCGIVHKAGRGWRIANSGEYLGVRAVISVEAKVSAAQVALEQATKNLRFASESYVLLGSSRITKNTESAFKRRGVGLIAEDCKTKLVEAEKGRLPATHVMLQFNEWVGRCISLGVIA